MVHETSAEQYSDFHITPLCTEAFRAQKNFGLNLWRLLF